MRRTFIVVLAALLTIQAHARLGWSEAQMEKKFKKVRSFEYGGQPRVVYKTTSGSGKYKVVASFIGDKVVLIQYSVEKRSFDKVKIPEGIWPKQMEAFMLINGDGAKWTKMGKEKSSMVWRRSGDHVAWWDTSPSLVTRGSPNPNTIYFSNSAGRKLIEKDKADEIKKLADDF